MRARNSRPSSPGWAEDVGCAESLLVEFEGLLGAADRAVGRDRLYGCPPLCVSAFPRNLKALKSAPWRPRDRKVEQWRSPVLSTKSYGKTIWSTRSRMEPA